ncbi:DUF2497 domain-containing protein [uncultured Cohaesibacter sp.]|uniref:PopZ family protein n=1 Tax=uncultured Cohaesibacter sp. TaxID=1002546 RepID=UPI0029C67372|nr:DUF2497 domain-containing protein [uncultured Cohaesibacter sp.]
MEEILASIRRIISDEEAAIADDSAPEEKAAPEEDAGEANMLSQEDLDALFDSPAPAEEEDDMAAAMAEMEAEEEEGDDVLELQSEWQETDLVEPQEEDLVFANEDEEPEAEEEASAPTFEQVVQETLETKVPEMLKSAFDTSPTPDGPLPSVERGAPLVSDNTSKAVHSAFGDLTHTILSNNTRTMENVVEDMLRPMLKAWLDQNLPVMVERLVRAEIERVSRGEQHYR